MSPTTATTRTHWLHPDLVAAAPSSSSDAAAAENNRAWKRVDCLCIGTGRFLRAVMVPILTRNGTVNSTVLVQPRGRSFVDFFVNHPNPTQTTYEIDTVLRDGSLESTEIPVAGAFTWNDEATTAAFYDICLPRLTHLSVLGIGVTEAGLASHDTPVMKALYTCLDRIRRLQDDHPAWQRHGSGGHAKICVIDMDNVPQNGTTLQRHMKALAAEANDNSMALFLDSQVVFVNTMVDRITSQREGSHGIVPRAEPVPQKALVVLDPHQDLPEWMRALQNRMGKKDDGTAERVGNTPRKLGLVIRAKEIELNADLALKLRIANGTHTALAHTMALLQCPLTDLLSQEKESSLANALLQYVQALVKDQILPATIAIATSLDAESAWQDWLHRLTHAHFGLSTFFITQNGAAKGGIRLGPTVTDLIQSSDARKSPLTVSMAFAFAALLRWLTPDSPTVPAAEGHIYRGWLPFPTPDGTGTTSYADGLRHNFKEGWYEFKCACNVRDPKNNCTLNLADWLSRLRQSVYEPSAYVQVVRAYLESPDGGNQSGVSSTAKFSEFCEAVAALYAQMVGGDDLYAMLKETMEARGLYTHGWSTPCAALVAQVQLFGGTPTEGRKKRKQEDGEEHLHKEKRGLSHHQEEESTTASTSATVATAEADGQNLPSEKWSKSKKKRMRKLRAAAQFQSKQSEGTPRTLNSGVPRDDEDGGSGQPTNDSKKSSLIHNFQARLTGSRFRILNEELYTTTSKAAFDRFSKQPELFEQYHEGFRNQVEQWPVNPVDVIIKDLKKKGFNSTKTIVVADFGCGDAELGRQLLSIQIKGRCPFTVHSFDLVATNKLVTACDMAHTPLDKASVDVAVFCLALMGTNLADFIREAHRVLKDSGCLKIAEVRSRFETKGALEVDKFLQVLEQLGFKCISQDKSNKMFFVLELRKNGRPPNQKLSYTAKPCIYKRR